MESIHQEQQHQSNASISHKSPVQSADMASTAAATTSSTTSTIHEQQPYSSDPFAPNFRFICPWGEEKRANFIETWPLPLRSDYWEVYESVEHAEFLRPAHQLEVLLRRRGLEDEYWSIFQGDRDSEAEDEREKTEAQRECDREEIVRKLLRDADEGGELLEKAEEVWRLDSLRKQALEGKIELEKLLEMGDVVGYNWIKLTEGLIEWDRDDTYGRKQGGGGEEGAATEKDVKRDMASSGNYVVKSNM